MATVTATTAPPLSPADGWPSSIVGMPQPQAQPQPQQPPTAHRTPAGPLNALYRPIMAPLYPDQSELESGLPSTHDSDAYPLPQWLPPASKTTRPPLAVTPSHWSSSDVLTTPSDGLPAARDYEFETDYFARMSLSKPNPAGLPPASDVTSINTGHQLRSARSAPLPPYHHQQLLPAFPQGPRVVGQHSPPTSCSRFRQPSPPQMSWNGIPTSGLSPAPQRDMRPPSHTFPPDARCDPLAEVGMGYANAPLTHPALDLDLSRQLEAASMAPPSSPWDAVVPPLDPSLSSPSLVTEARDEYAFDMPLAQARAALARPSWPSPASDRPRNRSYSAFTGDSPLRLSAAGLGTLPPNTTDVLAARMAKMGIGLPAQDARPYPRRQTTTSNTTPSQVEALRNREFLAAAMRGVPSEGAGAVDAAPVGGTESWSKPSAPTLPPSLWPEPVSPREQTLPPSPLDYPCERPLGTLSIPFGGPKSVALLGDLVSGNQEKAHPTSAQSFPCSHHDPSRHHASHSGSNHAPSGQRKAELYKTELCRKWSERGSCRYGAKCQFAHGVGELRPVERHHLYKTQVCRTFYHTGQCPYGVRCCFIHDTTPSSRPPPPPSGAAHAQVSPEFHHLPHGATVSSAPVEDTSPRSSSDTPSGNGENGRRQRSGSKALANRRTSRTTSGSSTPSGPNQASASVAVCRLHEHLHLARAHAGSASVPHTGLANKADPIPNHKRSSTQRPPGSRSTQASVDPVTPDGVPHPVATEENPAASAPAPAPGGEAGTSSSSIPAGSPDGSTEVAFDPSN